LCPSFSSQLYEVALSRHCHSFPINPTVVFRGFIPSPKCVRRYPPSFLCRTLFHDLSPTNVVFVLCLRRNFTISRPSISCRVLRRAGSPFFPSIVPGLSTQHSSFFFFSFVFTRDEGWEFRCAISWLPFPPSVPRRTR